MILLWPCQQYTSNQDFISSYFVPFQIPPRGSRALPNSFNYYGPIGRATATVGIDKGNSSQLTLSSLDLLQSIVEMDADGLASAQA